MWHVCNPKSDDDLKQCAELGKSLSRMSQPTILTVLASSAEPLHGYVIVQKAAASPMFGGKKPDPLDRCPSLLHGHHPGAARGGGRRFGHPRAAPARLRRTRVTGAIVPDPISARQPGVSKTPQRLLSGRAIAAALGPRPVIVVGTARDGRANFAPAAFCTPLSYEPPLVALGLKSTSWSGKAIEATGHSGRDTDKSEGFLCAWTEGGHALPYPQNALSVMEARVRSVTDAGDHRLFILEITEAATRLPKTEEGRLTTEPSLLCLEHSVFACARQIS